MKEKIKSDKLWTKDFILLCLVAVVARLAFTCQYTAIPLYVQAVGGDKTAAGAAAGIYSIAALLVRPVMGQLVDRRGRKFTLLLGIGIFAAAMSIYVIAGSLISAPAILIMQCVTGIGFAALTVGMTTMCTDIVPSSRLTQGIGIFGLSSTIANAIAPGLALMLIGGANHGWRIYFISVGVIAAVGFAEASLLHYESKKIPKKNENRIPERDVSAGAENDGKKAWWESIAEKSALFASGLIILAMLAASSINTFLPTLANEYCIAGIGVFFTLQAVGTAISRLGIDLVVRKTGSYAALNIGYACYVIAYLGIFSMRSTGIVCAMGLFSGIGQGVLQTILNTAAVVRTPEKRRGAANATFYMAMDIGIGSGGFLWGFIAEALGTRNVFIGTIFMVMGAAWLTFRHREKVKMMSEKPLS